MMTLIAVALTCWLCTLLAMPRKPLPNNEVQELVYARLMGRQQTLMLLALIATAGTLLALVAIARPNRVDLDFHAVCHPNASCVQGTYDPGLCPTPQAGTRVIREIQDDGRAMIVSTVTAPQP